MQSHIAPTRVRGLKPKEREVYGQSLTEYVRKKGGIRPDDVVRDLVRNKQLPCSILNEKGMGADELAALQDVLDFGIETESMQADNALLDALVNEYTTGEKRYSNAQLNAGLLAELQALDNLSRDIAAAGIDLNADNATIRDALSKYYEEQNGQNTGKESQTAKTERYEQRGFTESDTPTAEERAEANRQYDEVERKYRNTPLWMKAPNGEPTKLTERQWVQVRTPNFKRWFGDWEKAGIRERLESREPVAVEAKYNTASPKERRDIALGFFPENVTVTKPVGNVVISRRSIRSSFSHGSTDVKLDVMPYLTEILEKSEYIDTLQDFDGGNIQNHYFATKITHGGQNKLVFMRARKMPGRENQLYVHDVFVEEDIKQKDQSDVSKSGYSRNTVGQLRGSDLYKSILQDIYAVDKDAVSKVVDSNGEPKASDVEAFASDQNILYQREPVVRLTGNELGVPMKAPLEEHIAAAKKYHDVLREESKTNPVIQKQLGKPVRFSSRGWRKNVNSGADKRKWALFPKLREIIENATLIETTSPGKEKNKKFSRFHWMETPVWLDGKQLTVGMTLAEDVNGNLFYNLNPDVEMSREKKSSSQLSPNAQSWGLEELPDTESDVLEQSIGQNEDGVNLFILNEKNQGKVRGATIINPDRTMRIELFKDANYSTFVHETAHFMLEVYGDLASDPQSSEYIRNEYATIRKYLGAKDGEAITREQHEKFARSFEAYLMEGKAPSPELQGIFSRFRNRLLNIWIC